MIKIQMRAGPDDYCDFCSSTEKPLHTYACKTYTVASLGLPANFPVQTESTGGWNACTACKKLIDGEQWEELARRTTEEFIKKHPEAKPFYGELYRLIRDTHQEFRRARMDTN